LATGAAIDLMERQLGWSIFRARTHFLANYARNRIIELTGLEPQTPDSDQWYGSMVGLPLPPGNAADLQNALWQQYKIETPVIEHNGQRSIRVSCHVYNYHADIDLLVESLRTLLAAE
jgi:isopenicillin-N epimerase